MDWVLILAMGLGTIVPLTGFKSQSDCDEAGKKYVHDQTLGYADTSVAPRFSYSCIRR